MQLLLLKKLEKLSQPSISILPKSSVHALNKKNIYYWQKESGGTN